MQLDSAEVMRQIRPSTIRRREPRYVYSTPVRLQRFLRFGPFATRGMCLNISVGGMSALVCGAPRVGETVVIELPLREEWIEVLATVRHSNDAQSGFEFYPLSQIALDRINGWIRELEKHEEAPFPYLYKRVAGVGRSS
jgi:hypothetical protein